MAAPKGNKFWELRSKHGRDKLFKTPELLWEAACEYFQWCEDNPLTTEHVTPKGDIVKLSKPRPFKLRELCNYLDITDIENYAKDETYKDFWQLIIRIKNVIFSQKFDYAAIGEYNSNIIARDLGLKDQTENSTKVDINWSEEKTYEVKH